MTLEGKRIAILAEDGYEDLELWYPYLRLTEAGAEVLTLGTGKSSYAGKHGYTVAADGDVDAADPDEFDAVIIPGGGAPERMCRHQPLVEFVRLMHQRRKLIAFICHGAMVPAAAGTLNGATVTSYPGLQADLEDEGARWVDHEVVVDGNLISSRRPGDLPAFMREILGTLGEVVPSKQRTQTQPDIRLY